MLRYLGLSLREIAALLNTPVGRGTEPLTVTLARQRAALSERRDGLDRVLCAIEHTQRRAENDPAESEWVLYQTILEEIQMQEATDWTEKYYSPKAIEALSERRVALTSEEKTEIGARWRALFCDIQSALDREVPPDSAEGRALVARWMLLADEFTGGCTTTKAIGRMMRGLPNSGQTYQSLSTGPFSVRRSKPAYGTADMGGLLQSNGAAS